MCNIAEYITVRRAAHIVKSLSEKGSEYISLYGGAQRKEIGSGKSIFEEYEEDVSFNIQRRLEDILGLCLEGCRIKRFVIVNTEDSNETPIPITLLEIFSPSHAYIPIIITNESVLLISPFNNELLSKVSGDNQYIAELIPSNILTSNESLVEVDSYLNSTEYYNEYVEGMSVRDYIIELVNIFAGGILKQDQLLTRNFIGSDSGKIVEVSNESKIYSKLKKLYSLEALEKSDETYAGDVISPTDFMPIYLEYEKEKGFAVYVDNKEGDTTTTRLDISPMVLGMNPSEIEGNPVSAILTKSNLKYGILYVVDLGNCYYVGRSKVAFQENNVMVEVKDLYENFGVPDNSPIAKADEEFNEEIGTEAFDGLKKVFGMTGDALKGFWYVVRKFGIRQGSNAFIMFGQLFRRGGEAARWMVKQMMSTFKRGITLEKDETLEFQERVLNDELDQMGETIRMYAQTWFKAIPIAIFGGGMVYWPTAWLIAKYRTKKAKRQAMERVSRRIDNAIERLERKINYAEERSENETVDSLLREIHLYKDAKIRLEEFKQENFSNDRIDYVTFDKNLALTRKGRIEAMVMDAAKSVY